MKNIHALVFILTMLFSELGYANSFFASPVGTASGTGSINTPWDLQTALNQPATLLAGDTLFLRGGVYAGNFTSQLTGAVNNYIVVMAYPGERATLSDNRQFASGATLQVNGAWTIYQDFEITNTSSTRTSTSSQSFRPMGVQAQGAHTKFIHLVIHDTGHGFGFWKEAIDSEIYGCLIYNCGTQNSIGNYTTHGHAIYSQNNSGHKSIRDNIMFNEFGFGIHLYPNPGNVTGYAVEGNTMFHCGILTDTSARLCNFLVQTYPPYLANDIVFRNNKTYDDGTAIAHTTFYDVDVLAGDFTTGFGKIMIDSNYLVGNGRAGLLVFNWDTVDFQHNTTFYRDASVGLFPPSNSSTSVYSWDFNTYRGLIPTAQFAFQTNAPTDFPNWVTQSTLDQNSAYTNAQPTGTYLIQQPDQYTPGRSVVTVYNWDQLPSINFAPIGLSNGDAFEVIDVQDNYGAPVYAGIYQSANPTITIPTNLTNVSAPIGWPTPQHTTSRFNCFIVRKTLPVGIAEQTNTISNIVVYPNPTQHQCYIALPKGTDTPVHASVYAINGQVVWQMSDLAVSESRIALNLSSLETGMYLLILEGDSGKYYSRIEITGE